MVRKAKAPVVIVEENKPRRRRNRNRRAKRAAARALEEELVAVGQLDPRAGRARRQFRQRQRNQNTIAGRATFGASGRRMADTVAGEAVVHLAVDPFSYDNDLQIGWPDGTAEQVVTPHLTGQLPQLVYNTGYFSSGSTFEQLANASPWGTIVYYDPDVGVVFGMNYQGNLADPSALKTFWTERTLYGSRILLNDVDYTASRIIASGFTKEFTGNITANQGQATIVQVPIQCKQVGPTEVDLVTTYDFYAKILPLEDPTVGDMDLAAEAFITILPQDDTKVVRPVADEGHCCSMKILRPELPMYAFGFNTDDDVVVARGRYWNPLYTAFYGAAVPHSPTTALSLSVDVPSDILLHRQHNVMISHYTGLSPQASFRLKTRERPECTLTVGSALNFYSHASLDIDRNAMDTVREIHVKMLSAYPAEYNSLGGFFKKAASGWWNGMKKGFNFGKNKLLPMIPGGKEVGDMVDQIGGMVGLNSFQEEPRNNLRERLRTPTMRGLNRGLFKLALGMILLLPLAFAQPIQTIVCNNPATPDICGPNLPVYTQDEAVVAAIGGLGEGDQEFLNQINNNLKTSDGFSRAIALGLFVDGNAAYPLLPRVRDALDDIRSQNNLIIENLVSQLASLNTLVDLFAAGLPVKFDSSLLDATPSGAVLRVGVAANYVRNAHYNTPFWNTPVVFSESDNTTCFQTGLSSDVCATGYVPFAFKTGYYGTFDGSRIIAPLPVASSTPHAFAADASFSVT